MMLANKDKDGFQPSNRLEPCSIELEYKISLIFAGVLFYRSVKIKF